MKPTIAHIITGLNTGGAEIMLERLLIRHERSQFRPIVICLTNPGPIADRIRALGVDVVNLGLRPGVPNPIAIARIRNILKLEQTVVAQTWLYHADLLGGLAARSANIPVAWGLHRATLDPSITKRSVRLTAQACRRLAGIVPDCIVCCAESTRDLHIEFGYPAPKMMEIPNGFDLNQFKPDPDAATRIRTELGIGDGQVLVGIIGRFALQKNHQLFVKAASIASARNAKIRFAMIGDGLSIDNAELVAWIRASDHPDRFQLLGRRSDTPEVMAALDFVALSSDTEAFPLVIGEAMAVGKPCVATDVGDTARLIGDTGEIVPPRDAGALADAMVRMAERTSDERKQLGLRARKRIAAEFDIELIADRYEQLWRQLAAGEHPCG